MESLVVKKSGFIFLFLVLAILFSSGSRAASDQYEYEVFAAYGSSEDELSIFELNQYLLGISFYDQPVVYGDYPYLLTNFFERRTHLDFTYTNSDFESGSDEQIGDLYRINYSFASVGSPVLFNVGAARLVAEGEDFAGGFELDAVFYFFGFGYYISPNAIVNLELTAIDYELTDDDDPAQDLDYDETHLEASWQHVLKVDAEQYISILFEAEAVEIGSTKSSEIGATLTYFVNKKTGFGVTYSALRGDYGITEGNELGVSASVFIDGKTGFTAEINRLFADLTDSDEDSFFVKGIIRF